MPTFGGFNPGMTQAGLGANASLNQILQTLGPQTQSQQTLAAQQADIAKALQAQQAQTQQALQAQQGQIEQQLKGQEIAGQQALQAPALAEQLQATQLQTQAQQLPAQLQQQRFQTAFPYFQSLVSGSGLYGGGGGGGGIGVGGSSGSALPGTGAGGTSYGGSPGGPQPQGTNPADYLYGGPGAVQRQVNQGYATSQQQAATNIKNLQNQLAGRGFGANSPLAASLAAREQANANQAGQANETQFRSTAAQTAGQLGQQAAATQAQLQAALGQQQTQQYAARLGNLNAIIAALSGAF